MAEVHIQNFGPGLVTAWPGPLVPVIHGLGAATQCDNWDLSETLGILTKRKGIAEHIATNGTGSVCGLFEFRLDSGTNKVVVAADDDVYDISGGSFSSIFNDSGMNNATTNFAAFNDLLIIVNENITTQKWTGTGSSSNLGGSPPANVKFVVAHKGRVFMANSSAGSSRLHYSAVDDAEDWTTANNAGFIDINPEDGDEITGITSISAGLLVFKRQSTHLITGVDPETFSRLEISTSIGAVSGRSIVPVEEFAIFLSDNGVYSAGKNGIALMSTNINDQLVALPEAAKTAAAGGRLRNQYWLCYDSDADGENDSAYILDYVHGLIFHYTNINATVFVLQEDQTFLSGASDTEKVRQHDTGTDDEGTSITATWKSGEYDFGEFFSDKELTDVAIFTNTIAGKTVDLTTLLDGVANGSAESISIAPVSSETSIVKALQGQSDDYGKVIQFQIVNDEAAATVKVFGMNFKALVHSRSEEDVN